MILAFAVTLSVMAALLGIVVGFRLIFGIYLSRLEASKEIKIKNRDPSDIINMLKCIIDYGEPIRHTGIIAASLVALAAAIYLRATTLMHPWKSLIYTLY